MTTKRTDCIIQRCLRTIGMTPESYGWNQCKAKLRGDGTMEIIGSHWKRRFQFDNLGGPSLTNHKCNSHHEGSVRQWVEPEGQTTHFLASRFGKPESQAN